ncbi:phenoloxidase-activating factor 1-like [Photinus pyralis]|nr:phenoloxidase-activating factor 1-like [Photinus pyralis]
MLKYCLLFLVTLSHALENNTICYRDLNCIPLSECEEIIDFVNVDNYTNYARSLSCGYFHEPYVCCNRNCITPNGSHGRMVLLQNCPNLEKNTLPQHKNKQKFLKDSFVNETHVCCNRNEDGYKTVLPAPIDDLANNALACVTPNGENAKCTGISSCSAYAYVASKTNQHFGFINDSFCGYWQSPMVCCGTVSAYKENYAANLPKEDVCGIWNSLSHDGIPPWVGMIEVSNSHENMCIGALINHQYLISTPTCAGSDEKKLIVKFGNCITNSSYRSECRFKVKQIKTFPLYNYLHSDDTGIALLKLAGTTTKSNRMPICLPENPLPIRQRVNIHGLEMFGATKIVGNSILGTTLFNDDCDFGTDLKYICLRRENVGFFPYRYIVAKSDNRQWYLEGIFNWKDWKVASHENIYSVYVYKFVSWIKSNIS